MGFCLTLRAAWELRVFIAIYVTAAFLIGLSVGWGCCPWKIQVVTSAQILEMHDSHDASRAQAPGFARAGTQGDITKRLKAQPWASADTLQHVTNVQRERGVKVEPTDSATDAGADKWLGPAEDRSEDRPRGPAAPALED